jgi:hypothetical protein
MAILKQPETLPQMLPSAVVPEILLVAVTQIMAVTTKKDTLHEDELHF